jgi:hypothetical protein
MLKNLKTPTKFEISRSTKKVGVRSMFFKYCSSRPTTLSSLCVSREQNKEQSKDGICDGLSLETEEIRRVARHLSLECVVRLGSYLRCATNALLGSSKTMCMVTAIHHHNHSPYLLLCDRRRRSKTQKSTRFIMLAGRSAAAQSNTWMDTKHEGG